MKTFESKSRESYNQKADDYDKTFDGKYTIRFKEVLLEELVVENKIKILDVACGNGTFLKMLSNKHDIEGHGINPLVPLSKAGDVKFYSPREIQSNFEEYGFENVDFKRDGHIQIFKMQRR